MHETILLLSQSLTDAGENEQFLLGMLCTAAEGEWAAQLRTGITPADCGDVFLCAAAFTAAANLLSGRSGGSVVSSFTAGSISASEKSAAETNTAAAALRNLAVRLMAPYTAEDSFCFRGVRS